jgi:hypothetical protein
MTFTILTAGGCKRSIWTLGYNLTLASALPEISTLLERPSLSSGDSPLHAALNSVTGIYAFQICLVDCDRANAVSLSEV